MIRLFRWSGADEFEMPLYTETLKPPQPIQKAEDIKANILNRLTK